MSGATEVAGWLGVVQAACTFGMTGVIWFVQLVQYPGFARVGAGEFRVFHEHHCRAIGWIVGPLMTMELLTAVFLAWVGSPQWFWGVMLGALLAIWLSTALWQGPLHGRLAKDGLRPDLIRWLVRGNWLRTILWTARSVGLIWFYARG